MGTVICHDIQVSCECKRSTHEVSLSMTSGILCTSCRVLLFCFSTPLRLQPMFNCWGSPTSSCVTIQGPRGQNVSIDCIIKKGKNNYIWYPMYSFHATTFWWFSCWQGQVRNYPIFFNFCQSRELTSWAMVCSSMRQSHVSISLVTLPSRNCPIFFSFCQSRALMSWAIVYPSM